MSNNFLISLRNNKDGKGTPGTGFGDTAYLELSPTDTSYNLTSKIDQDKWLGHIAGTTVLVFVHGFGNGADKVVLRHKQVKPYIPRGVTLVSFDWPSGNPGINGYRDDKANAKRSSQQLIRDCLQFLLTRFSSANINLFAHSMGAYVTENALFLVPDADPLKINHVMLAAADVDRLNYAAGGLPLTNFLAKCNDLTAYWSTHDKALQDSAKMPINHGAIPLGLRGFPDAAVPAKCRAVDCSVYYQNYCQGITPIEPGLEFSHVWYLLYAPPAPALNDFYPDMADTIRVPWLTEGPTTDPNGFLLQRPTDA
jgi:pimeloyl-ACP methyl ester carboxylesterase